MDALLAYHQLQKYQLQATTVLPSKTGTCILGVTTGGITTGSGISVAATKIA